MADQGEHTAARARRPVTDRREPKGTAKYVATLVFVFVMVAMILGTIVEMSGK
jgi:hypothetical protein